MKMGKEKSGGRRGVNDYSGNSGSPGMSHER
jgi:hypothetical protein